MGVVSIVAMPKTEEKGSVQVVENVGRTGFSTG